MTTLPLHAAANVFAVSADTAFAITWLVSRPALRATMSGIALRGQPEIGLELRALLCPDGHVQRIEAVIEGTAVAVELTTCAFGNWIVDSAANHLHLLVAEPSSDTPLLDATIRICSDGSLTVLYARTTLLAHLGIPGGRYEVSGARWSLSDSAG
jgi:hypothetical protein